MFSYCLRGTGKNKHAYIAYIYDTEAISRWSKTYVDKRLIEYTVLKIENLTISHINTFYLLSLKSDILKYFNTHPPRAMRHYYYLVKNLHVTCLFLK